MKTLTLTTLRKELDEAKANLDAPLRGPRRGYRLDPRHDYLEAGRKTARERAVRWRKVLLGAMTAANVDRLVRRTYCVDWNAETFTWTTYHHPVTNELLVAFDAIYNDAGVLVKSHIENGRGYFSD